MKKVCIYCRVNSPKQADGSAERMELQIARCKKAANLHNFTVVDEVRDFGKSSFEKVSNRRALNEMIERSRRGEFEVVVIPTLKVFSLNVEIANDIYEKIKETGAEVISDNDGEVDEKMMQKLKGAAIYGRMFGENDNQN